MISLLIAVFSLVTILSSAGLLWFWLVRKDDGSVSD
ncbi:hypothetical protein Poly41_38480 [Novipirellula artificiosorum]|uniref:Uncharacterized protein n=1 Tax=Novipirellula artificiosorum TaxID=2528016 RepID=A0A5C6DIQ5_9BACT|nr:hypothetical protein Poly41_38480 [Novipirellula artificiosorum]